MAKYIHFGFQGCQKTVLCPRMLKVKVVDHWIPYKKSVGA